MVVTLEDVMRRRTPLALSRAGGPEVASQVAGIMAPLMGWNDNEARAQVARYIEEWNCKLP
jgi:glycerol-3-phosphate dehydrogenase